MFKKSAFALALSMTAITGISADAAVLRLDGYSSSVQGVSIGASPVPGTPGSVGATGFNVTDTTGSEGSFLAWCLDIAHYLMGVGSSQNYTETNAPFSNSYGLSAVAKARVQSVFDANYASLDATDGDQAAAFQIVLWEAAYEDDGNAMSLANGLFQATSSGSDAFAATFIANAAAYTGGPAYDLTFWEVDGDANRGKWTGQNLVSANPVPVPAAGWLLLAGLGGLAATRRRKT